MTAHWRPSLLNAHLGASVSALVDGQLDEVSTERAWDHVLACPPCRRLVETEGQLKRRLGQMAGSPAADRPSDQLLDSLLDLGPVATAWADTDAIEQRSRNRRRAGLVLVGAGSVSAAVLGLTTLGPVGFGGNGAPATSLHNRAPSSTPTAAFVAPAASVHGRLRGFVLEGTDDGVAHAHAVDARP